MSRQEGIIDLSSFKISFDLIQKSKNRIYFIFN